VRNKTSLYLLLTAVICAGAAAAYLQAPSHAEPPHADPTALFDPAIIARSMCGGGNLSLGMFSSAAAAETPPSKRLWPGLGAHSFKVTTQSAEAQAYFDQGLRLVYAFNFGEALASFRAAQEHDPSCALCFWGEGFALGPNLNAAMPAGNAAPAWAATKKAADLAPSTTPLERALIAALAERYSSDPTHRREPLDTAYADAMYRVYQLFGDDPDVATLHADAALYESRTTGWWINNGRLPTPRAAAALVALERALKLAPDHAGAIHYYIHAMDSSTRPERAEPFAEKLAQLMPGAGHIVHMPAHIYFRRGRYIEALDSNIAALKVDDAYLAQINSADGVYRHQLYAHNLHFAVAAAGMAGDRVNATSLALRLEEFLSRGAIERPDMYAAAALHPRVRFAAPEEIRDLPEPPAQAPYLRGIWLYARGSAHVYAGDLLAARASVDALARLRQDTRLEDLLRSYIRAPHILLLAEEVVRGRIAAHERRWDDSFKHFAAAAAIQDQVRGFDPPAWDFPVRQSLGIALLKAGRAEDAATVLREALMEAPHNGVVLYALIQAAIETQDETAAAAYRKLYERAWRGDRAPDLDRF